MILRKRTLQAHALMSVLPCLACGPNIAATTNEGGGDGGGHADVGDVDAGTIISYEDWFGKYYFPPHIEPGVEFEGIFGGFSHLEIDATKVIASWSLCGLEDEYAYRWIPVDEVTIELVPEVEGDPLLWEEAPVTRVTIREGETCGELAVDAEGYEGGVFPNPATVSPGEFCWVDRCEFDVLKSTFDHCPGSPASCP